VSSEKDVGHDVPQRGRGDGGEGESTMTLQRALVTRKKELTDLTSRAQELRHDDTLAEMIAGASFAIADCLDTSSVVKYLWVA